MAIFDDKLRRAERFRQRLHHAMALSKMTQTGLAKRIGVDRSTLSQLLKDDGARLPGAQLVALCAQSLGVSADWLLGLSEHPERASDLLAGAMVMTQASRSLIDDQIFQWHQEAAGYKIRHVPANLPDILKTRAVLAWEYAQAPGRSGEQAIAASEDRLNWMRSGTSDYEITFATAELEAFCAGVGYYAHLPVDQRRAQIRHIRALHDQLYPRMRIFLFDARQFFSAPLTIFGPLLTALYLGQNYLVFRDTDRIQAMIQHFDYLIREAAITPRELPAYLDAAEARLRG